MLAKGKAPKVLAAASRKTHGSRSHTWSRGAKLALQPARFRHKARKGWQLERQHFFVKD